MDEGLVDSNISWLGERLNSGNNCSERYDFKILLFVNMTTRPALGHELHQSGIGKEAYSVSSTHLF